LVGLNIHLPGLSLFWGGGANLISVEPNRYLLYLINSIIILVLGKFIYVRSGAVYVVAFLRLFIGSHSVVFVSSHSVSHLFAFYQLTDILLKNIL
jgi:hypothetical protein